MPVPSENSNRWANLTPENRSGALYVVAFLTLTYSCCMFLARIYIKWHKSGVDDVAMLVAQVISMAQFALLLVSLSAGLGKSYSAITQGQYLRIAATQYGGQITIYLSLGFSKLATILLVRRLFPPDMTFAIKFCNAVTVVIALSTLASAVLVSVGCSAQSLSPKTSSQSCPGIEARYLAVIIIDAITDLILVIVPAFLCRKLRMKVSVKLQVLGVFGLRLPLIVLAALYFTTWKRSLHSDDPGVACSNPLIYQQTELCYSLMVSTIPCLHSFLKSADSCNSSKIAFANPTHSGSYDQKADSQEVSRNQRESYEMSENASDNGSLVSRRDGNARYETRANKIQRSPGSNVAIEDEGVDCEWRSAEESDQKSHHSTQALFIRNDVEWGVIREASRKGSDINTPRLPRLPQ